MTAADVEQMLKDCVPGGSFCDPQAICDDIREWFRTLAAQPAPVAPTPDQIEGEWKLVPLRVNQDMADAGKSIDGLH
jgi:hypothetical protein